MRQLPTLTHLQFLVVGLLLEKPTSGRNVRARLKAHGARRSSPAFYQLMARLEDSGVVEGHYEQVSMEGQTVRERHYRVTADGERSWRASGEFYAEVAARVPGAPGLSHA